jgi:hypothetical protein
MLGISFSGWLMFGIGLLAGLLLGNKDFRIKFFKGLRSFFSSVGRGAQEQNKQSQDELRRMGKGMQEQGRRTVGREDKEKRKSDRFNDGQDY